MPDASDPITAALNFGDALAMLVTGMIPKTQAEVDCLNKYFPAVAARRLKRAALINLKSKEDQINQAAEWVKTHKIDPIRFAMFVNGDTTYAQLIQQDVAGMGK